MKRGDLPRPPGKASKEVMDKMGGDLLDDILTDPRGISQAVTGGKFSGGTLIVRPDGIGAVFDSGGAFHTSALGSGIHDDKTEAYYGK